MTEAKSAPMALEEVEKLKHASPIAGVPDLFLKRWSPRAFADREVAASDLETVFLAASWAASSFNEQPWRFLVGRKGDETYRKIFGSLVEFNQMWAKSAPILILSAGKKTFSHNASPNKFGLHDTGAATALLMLQATALGLHTHSMAGFNSDQARASFEIPEDYEIGAVTALGYLGDPYSLPDQMREKELEPRSRKPLGDFVFSEWETAAKL